MRPILLPAFCFLLTGHLAFSQSCLPESIIFGSQSHIESLQINYPGTITLPEVIIAAKQQLVKLGKSNGHTLTEVSEITHDSQVLAYVIGLDPAGYIVVGACCVLPPVIAYSFESHFGQMGRDNPLYELLKADLSERLILSSRPGDSGAEHNKSLWEAILNDHPMASAGPLFEQWPATGDGWLKTNWTQSAPYNNFCPMDPVTSLKSFAGCPATAMAQIMNFHETTNNTYFNDSDDYFHNYAGRQYWIDDDFEAIDFPGFPELNAYLDTLDAHYIAGTALTADDKAALTFACGTAARQVYTSQGSGTFGVSQAYDAYIRFGCSTVELLDSNDADLYDRLKQNIMDTLPAHLAVVDEAWSTGHNVVVDGYNTDEYYHLNFGWGGSYNGWYLLPQEIPYELTVVEGVVVDIMKKSTTGIASIETNVEAISVYPNPVSDMAYLNYSLKDDSPVILSIYNPSGILILNCELGNEIPGQYSVPVSFADQPSGLYFYSLRAGNGFSSGKIIRAE